MCGHATLRPFCRQGRPEVGRPKWIGRFLLDRGLCGILIATTNVSSGSRLAGRRSGFGAPKPVIRIEDVPQLAFAFGSLGHQESLATGGQAALGFFTDCVALVLTAWCAARISLGLAHRSRTGPAGAYRVAPSKAHPRVGETAPAPPDPHHRAAEHGQHRRGWLGYGAEEESRL